MSETTQQPQYDLASVRLVLDEKRRAWDAAIAAARALDGKLQNLMLGAGFQITLAAGVRAATAQGRLGAFFWPALLATMALYLAMFVVILRGMRSTGYIVPISTDWDELSSRYFVEHEQTALFNLIRDYVDTVNSASTRSAAKGRLLNAAMILFVVTLAMLLLALWL